MLNEIMMMFHVGFGVMAIVLAAIVWGSLFGASEVNLSRVRFMTNLCIVCIFLAYIIGGYWYLTTYQEIKVNIKNGPFPWGHTFFMEVKEHVFFVMLFAAMLLKSVLNSIKGGDRELIPLARTSAAVVVLSGFVIDGFGAFISMGYRLYMEAL